MRWIRNSGTGDRIGTRVNLNQRRPLYHAEAPDYIRSGRALCGRRMHAGFETTEPGARTCKRCARMIAGNDNGRTGR